MAAVLLKAFRRGLSEITLAAAVVAGRFLLWGRCTHGSRILIAGNGLGTKERPAAGNDGKPVSTRSTSGEAFAPRGLSIAIGCE